MALTVLLALSLGATIAGCGKAATKTPANTTTAKGELAVAQSSLSTMAPDAKLLVVQSASVITTASPPVWEYLFGSPKSDAVYAVVVQGGKASAQQYGQAGLKAAEWAAIPGIDKWKIDSDEALKRALAVYKTGNATTAYMMGFETYVPKASETSTIQAMTWNVLFDPASQGNSPTSTVSVNVTTGEATFAK